MEKEALKSHPHESDSGQSSSFTVPGHLDEQTHPAWQPVTAPACAAHWTFLGTQQPWPTSLCLCFPLCNPG